jgi:NAD(P)-dependent dehydrogenase (short-subunit alcohol dehydrogenase family)
VGERATAAGKTTGKEGEAPDAAAMSDPARVAIITGGGRGMGAACARELSSRGWKVSLLSPSGSAETLASTLGGIGFKGSVEKAEDLERVVGTTADKYGRIDGVVVSFGAAPKGELLTISDSDWLRGAEMIVLSTVRLARLVTPIMQRQKGGSIVNISTFAAYEPDPLFPVSSTYRAGLGSFAKLYADRYAPDGIRMNNILPGYIDSATLRPEIIPRIPMRRYGTVREIACTAAFLLSDEGGYITGQNLRVDGGLTRSV